MCGQGAGAGATDPGSQDGLNRLLPLYRLLRPVLLTALPPLKRGHYQSDYGSSTAPRSQAFGSRGSPRWSTASQPLPA